MEFIPHSALCALRSIERRPEMNILRREPDFRQFVQRAADEWRA